jgi:hypothetical protein
MRKGSSIAAVVLAAGLAVPVARAESEVPAPAPAHEPKPDPAKVAAAKLVELVKKGTELCAAGDLDEGLPALRAAWTQKQDPDIAVALATCEIKASDWPGAADHLAFALRNKSDPEQRKALEPTFVNVRARVGGVKVTVTLDGADVFVGDRFAGQSPLPGEVYVTPGQGRIFAKKTGYGEVEGVVEVKANGTAALTLDLAGEGAVAQSRRTTSTRSRTPAYVMGGIGFVALSAGVALYAAGAAKGSAADDLLAELHTCAGGAPGCATLKSLRSSHDTFVNAGAGLMAGGGAFVGASIIYGLWATFAAPAEAPRTARFTVVPSFGASPAGGGLGLRGTF